MATDQDPQESQESQESQDPQKPQINFIELLSNETLMSVIFILQTYESLNLRQISTVMGISEPSTHAHIKKLLDRKIIELDSSKAGQRGKYYRLHPLVESIIDRGEADFEVDREKIIDATYYTMMGQVLRTVSIMTQRFGSYLGKYLENNAQTLANDYQKQLQDDTEIKPSAIASGNLSMVQVRTEEEFNEIKKAYTDFVAKVEEINSRNHNLQYEDMYESVMISGIIIPLLKIDPRK
ncbi:MAG: winged helix-turn-helix transcriptional regulator [Candidatus Kariarchaeaceae archaeon]|jgi:DNA-binding MarR family transcriptional regulator